MTKNGRRGRERERQADSIDLRRALDILSQPDADDRAIETAIETLLPLSAPPAPPPDFSRRVMLAVHQASLPEGRVPLSTPLSVWSRAAVFGAAAAAVAWGAIATFGPSAAPMLATMLAFIVRIGLSTVTSIRIGLQIWSATAATGAALASAIASPGIAIVLAATALVGMLSLTALIQLLSTKQEPSRWPGPSLFI